MSDFTIDDHFDNRHISPVSHCHLTGDREIDSFRCCVIAKRLQINKCRIMLPETNSEIGGCRVISKRQSHMIERNFNYRYLIVILRDMNDRDRTTYTKIYFDRMYDFRTTGRILIQITASFIGLLCGIRRERCLRYTVCRNHRRLQLRCQLAYTVPELEFERRHCL